MKIIQILPTLSYGDAIGNHAISLKKLFQTMGYETQIYAENIDSRLPKGTGYSINRLPRLNENDIVFYHLSTWSKLNYSIGDVHCRKVINYHNITPPHFFAGYSIEAKKKSRLGLQGARYLSDKADYVIAVSEFNKRDLKNLGYSQKIDVAPILISFEDYKQSPSESVIRRYKDGKTNILFTGRIAPNKKQEDIIQAFYYYKKYINSEARLFLVGNYRGMEKYYEKLQNYVKELDLQDVYFTGHIPFNEILAYYQIADLFVCMSEHEGFCVPLVEAMYFQVPILAYDSTAIPETLQSGGILLKEKDPKLTAEWMERLTRDFALRNYILEKQRIRLKDLNYETVSEQYRRYLDQFILEGM